MSDRITKTILITGGAGFIGSHVVKLLLNKYPSYKILNFDKLTYAGNLENLKDVEKNDNYVFIHGDICDTRELKELFKAQNVKHCKIATLFFKPEAYKKDIKIDYVGIRIPNKR